MHGRVSSDQRPEIQYGFIRDYNRTAGVQSLTVSRLSTLLEDEDNFDNPIEPNRVVTAQGIDGPGLDNASLQTLSRFSGFVDGRPTMGVLLVNESGGSSFRINADSGENNTFILTGDERGRAFGYWVPWSEGFSF